MTHVTCLWCPKTFEAKDGKKFCSAKCRAAYHDACRRYCEQMAHLGLLDVATIKRVAEEHRKRLAEQRQRAAA